MYAVIKTGGKQYRVQPGDVLVVEKLDGDVGAEVSFDQVLMLGGGEAGVLGDDLGCDGGHGPAIAAVRGRVTRALAAAGPRAQERSGRAFVLPAHDRSTP